MDVFTVSRLFNNDADKFLGYSNAIRNTLLSDSPVIFNPIVNKFEMIIVCGNDEIMHVVICVLQECVGAYITFQPTIGYSVIFNFK